MRYCGGAKRCRCRTPQDEYDDHRQRQGEQAGTRAQGGDDALRQFDTRIGEWGMRRVREFGLSGL